MSRRSKCRLYIVRCPPAKHAIDDTTDSKYRKRFTMETFLIKEANKDNADEGLGSKLCMSSTAPFKLHLPMLPYDASSKTRLQQLPRNTYQLTFFENPDRVSPVIELQGKNASMNRVFEMIATDMNRIFWAYDFDQVPYHFHQLVGEPSFGEAGLVQGTQKLSILYEVYNCYRRNSTFIGIVLLFITPQVCNRYTNLEMPGLTADLYLAYHDGCTPFYEDHNGTRPLQLTEPNWSLQELKGAIERMKANKASDECGLVAELLHFAPENVVTALLGIMNQILHTGQVPSSWQKTMFQMLPKTKNARTTKDFRPIANIRLIHKTFAYLILGRIEEPLEHAQPEEQHGFRTKRRIEEHLLSANMVIDKTLLANKPLWILSLDLSKAFDRVDWDALWSGLRLHGVSVHLIWLLQLMYSNQTGQISGHSDVSREFCIRAGVRQGCVLSPRLFCSVLQLAMEDWRCDVSNNGLDLGNRGPPLLDLRFADDILLFAGSA